MVEVKLTIEPKTGESVNTLLGNRPIIALTNI